MRSQQRLHPKALPLPGFKQQPEEIYWFSLLKEEESEQIRTAQPSEQSHRLYCVGPASEI